MPLVPPAKVHEFFNTMAALMSLQLRSLVMDSLQELLDFFTIHKVWGRVFLAALKQFCGHTQIIDAFVETALIEYIVIFSVLCVHQDGNDFGEVFDEMMYIKPQGIQVKLEVEETRIIFYPSLPECWTLIQRAFMEIIKSAQKLPRVQHALTTANFLTLIICG